MMGNVEDIFIRANFTKGSNHKEELRGRLFGGGSRTNVRSFTPNRSTSTDELVKISDEELGEIAAAGSFNEHKDDNDL